MKKFREIVREASQAVYGNKPQGGEIIELFLYWSIKGNFSCTTSSLKKNRHKV